MLAEEERDVVRRGDRGEAVPLRGRQQVLVVRLFFGCVIGLICI